MSFNKLIKDIYADTQLVELLYYFLIVKLPRV